MVRHGRVRARACVCVTFEICLVNRGYFTIIELLLSQFQRSSQGDSVAPLELSACAEVDAFMRTLLVIVGPATVERRKPLLPNFPSVDIPDQCLR